MVSNKCAENTPATPDLIKALYSQSLRRRLDATEMLVQRGDNTIIPALVDVIYSDQLEARCAAIFILGQIGDATIIPILLDVMHIENGLLEGPVVIALGDIGDISIVPDLLQLLRDNYRIGTGVRDTIKALGQLGDARAVPDLIEILNDNNDLVAEAAAQALIKIATTEAWVAVIKFRHPEMSTSEALAAIENWRRDQEEI